MVCRFSEALTLNWRNIDLKNNQIHFVKTKNDEPRALPIRKDIQLTLAAIPEDERTGFYSTTSILSIITRLPGTIAGES